MSRVLIPVTIFLSAFLLFQVQPIMGRFILPWFGGTPAVWSVCLLFFQAMLLAGYAYAHWLRRPRIHVALLAVSLAFLPVIPARPAITDTPSARILLLLAITVGVPYFLLSATAPLLQKWSSSERSPWRLYALSNLGSFLALLSYPFLVEPYVRLRAQAWVWSGVYVAFALLCGSVAWAVGQAISSPVSALENHEDSARPTVWTILFWLGLSAAGSTLLLATTNIVTQDIAVSPFLWIAPLSLYLLTFVLAFESDRWYPRLPFAIAAGVLAPVACAVVNAGVGVAIWVQLGVYLATLFVICMLCHGELRYAKPDPRHLTLFYLTVAAGGVLGGVFVALIAPRVFTEFDEYPIALAAACLLGLTGWLRSGAWSLWTQRNFAIRIPIMALLLGGLSSTLAVTMSGSRKAVGTWRNFYGILRVTDLPDPHGALFGGMRELTHGRIKHGSQYLEQALRDRPISYYGPHSGVAMALNALPEGPRRIAVIGLGTGTMAAWGRPGDFIRFYEINPLVQTIATTFFTFLPDSKAKTEVVLGDARIQLEHEQSVFDFIVVDAFSSDAIPMHLLTAEAADIYRKHLTPGGLLLFHISNRSLNLEPVVRGIAQQLNWNAAQILAGDDPATGEDGSSWVIVTENLELLQRITRDAPNVGWTDPKRPPILWTDDFASLWHVLKW
ncbi:MAG TPA: fused MFS/spermidine synthase [Bryobacteraceae bacterium]|nr:fused MFS/spermidine synthase [Bryobacteraceae bacterium]